MQAATLDSTNYAKGFLIDEELLGGISPHPEQEGSFLAYVIRHTTGEYLGCQPFGNLDDALAAINLVERSWHFEAAGGCGGGNCGTENGCKGESCSLRKAGEGCAMGPCPMGHDQG